MGCTTEILKGRMTESRDLNQAEPEADWLKEGGREDNWTRVMRSVLRWLLFHAVKLTGKQADE